MFCHSNLVYYVVFFLARIVVHFDVCDFCRYLNS